MVYLTRGSFWSTTGQVVTSFIVLGFAVLVAHFVPKDVYGEYKYIIAMVAILSSLSLTGLNAAVFQSVARGFDGALFEGFWINIRWSVLIFLGAFMLAIYYFLQGNATLALGVLIGGSLSPFLASANLSAIFLSAKKDFARSAIYFDIIENLSAIGLLAVTVLVTKNPLLLVAAYFVGNTLSTYLLYRRVVRVYNPDPSKRDPEMLTYGKHLSLMGVIGTIAGNIDQILLFHFAGPVELAIYNFATAIPDQSKGLFKALNTMLQAKFVHRPPEEIHASMRNKMLWLFISVCIAIALYILLAPYFFAFFFPNYVGSVPYSQLYALSLVSVVIAPAASYLAAKKKVKEQYLSGIAGAVMQIGLVVVGVVWFGLLGLVLSRVIFRIGNTLLTFALYDSAIRKEIQ